MMDEDSLASLIGGDGAGAPVAEAPEEAGRMPAVPEGGASVAQEEAGATPTVPDAATVREEPAPEPAVEPGHVPIAAMLDEREKRLAAERRLAEVEAERKAAQAQARAAQAPAEERQALQMFALRRDLSRELLASKHGEEEARALEAWGFEKCEADPQFNQQVLAARNPYEFIRQARARERLLAEVSPDDLEDYRAWKTGRAAGDSPGPVPSTAPRSPSPASGGGSSGGGSSPPRSLVTAPNAGGGGRTEIPVGPGAAFASAIRR